MVIVIMGTPFSIALLQIRLCKKGSNFGPAPFESPLFVQPDARFGQRHWFARQGFRHRSAPPARRAIWIKKVDIRPAVGTA
jgi:hypothetical protein